METLKLNRNQEILIANEDRSYLFKPMGSFTFHYLTLENVLEIIDWANFQGFCDEEKITPYLIGTFFDCVKKEYKEDSCAIDDALDKVRSGKLYLKDILD